MKVQMLRTAWFLLTSLPTVALATGGHPHHGPCASYIAQHCEGQRGPAMEACLAEGAKAEALPAACKASYEARVAEREALVVNCGEAVVDECKGSRKPFGKFFSCLEAKGNAACVSQVATMKEKFAKRRNAGG